MRKIKAFICCSLDGYIAGPNGDMSFLSQIPNTGEDHGYGEFMQTIDTVLVGRKTYDWVMTQVDTFPHASLETFVIGKGAPLEDVIRFDGNPVELAARLKEETSRKDIFCDGGSQLLNSLIDAKLVDEIIVSIVPIVLGGGTPLFTDQSKGIYFELLETTSFKSGLVQLKYSL